VIEPPREVLTAYGWSGLVAEPLDGGLINATYAVRGPDDPTPRGVVQRLHPIFGREVNLDLEAIADAVAAAGLATPRLIRTRDGAEAIAHDGAIWRAITWLDGATFAKAPSLAHIRSAGALVGRWHHALRGFARPFAFVRAGVHDTAGHLARMAAGAAAPATAGEPAELAEARALAAAVRTQADALPPLGDAPRRVCHGDLKLANVRFAADRPEAIALLDLDTCGRMPLAHELGDALRSWCNPAGEDVTAAAIDPEIFAAAIDGWGSTARAILAPGEAATLVDGLETMVVELAARFTADVFEDRYFGWDAARYPSRRAHNLVRARGQATLAASVRAARPELERHVRAALG
jgi:Ser/Thr protein kinase RdoA (MazF antagonist)